MSKGISQDSRQGGQPVIVDLNTPKAVLKALQRAKGKWPEISNLTGLTYNRICHLGTGRAKRLFFKEVVVLAIYFGIEASKEESSAKPRRKSSARR